METKQYAFSQCSVQKDALLYSIIVNDYKKITPEQINLFNLIINFGYTPIPTEELIITDEQIVNFWNYAKDSILKNMDLNKYYSAFGIAPIFTSKVPTLKLSGAFFSEKYEIIVTWINDVTVSQIKAQPQRYKRIGLELYSFDDEIKGSIMPDYYYLYKIVDDANSNWHQMTKSEKYNFLVELRTISENTRFIMPSDLISTLTDMQQS